MKCIVFVALIACAWAAPKEAEVAQQPFQLPEFISNAQKNLNELAQNIKNQINIPDQETVVNTLKNQSSSFVTNVQSYIDNVSEEIKKKTPELQNVWSDIKTKLNKVVEDINAQVPHAKESAEQLQKQFNEGVQTLVKESNNFAEQVKQNAGPIKEEIASFTKKAVDIAVEASENLNEQLKKAAQQVEKKD
ncbi:uncharacterized protein LOC131663756 [Phymastichus coffea]|uniref:uncharacterized protein LOC131663756 n=1 Tax=Phymastichus coffea TaxID=108790 RepID=UPI00273C8D02|nr:uncharacterized protein LOC131663756 [Phymastichus coffea]